MTEHDTANANANVTLPSNASAIEDKRDLRYALATMAFAALVAAVLLYGGWWRQARLPAKYEALHDAAEADYEQQLAIPAADRDPDVFFTLGSRVDVLSRRLYRYSIDPSRQWQRSEFLRAHAHRLSRLVQSPDDWSDPALLEDAAQRIGGYLRDSQEMAEKVLRSNSIYSSDANLRRIEDALANSSLDQTQINEYRELLDSVILQADDHRRSADSGSKDQDFQKRSRLTRRRAALLSGILLFESAWDDAPNDSPLIANQQSIDRAVLELTELRSSLTDENDVGNRLLDTIALALRSQLDPTQPQDPPEDEVSNHDDFSDALASLYTESIISDSKLNTSTHLVDWLPGLAACCLQENWSRANELIRRAGRQDALSSSEVSFIRRWTAKFICRLMVSKGRASSEASEGASMSDGLSLAIAMDAGGDETCSMLYTIARLRSKTESPNVEPSIASRFASATDSAMAIPSQPASLVSAMIAAGMDADTEKQIEIAETAEMLQSDLPTRVAFVALWRYSVVAPPANVSISNDQAISTRDDREAAIWSQIIEALIDPDAQDSSGLAYCQLAQSAWQFHNNKIDESFKNLIQARDKLGPHPIVGQLERAHADRKMSKLNR
ncbi:hypothetical protein Poly59_17930 [Rubripirellula reticaptiva]|uniref:Uncharacterized protein n=2 Tax=Rubripirellula reticaptiva TaxID=2528013 RepID=A0A5C6F4Q8_9BACT|nr:hypothetical protein Poly59_17930 [Rubripirellula reticaptiva]